jgi:predicted dehydrogenase
MINAAVVGLGRWGRNIVEAVQGRSGRLRFVRGVDSHPQSAADFARLHDLSLSAEFRDVLDDPAIDAVFLATPHSLHVEQVEAVAAAGKPVWCEKPLALTRREAERAVTACAVAGVPFALGNNKRFFPAMRALNALVAEGGLGEVLHIEGHFTNEHSTRVAGGWRDDPDISPGGGLTGAGLHVIDAFVNLAGPIATVDAKLFSRKSPPDPRDVAAAFVTFENGGTGQAATVRAGPMFWRVHVFGTRGWAEVRGEMSMTVALVGQEPVTRDYPAEDSLAFLIEAFAETIASGKPFPVPTAEMLDVAGAFEAAILSMRTGAPVQVARG